MGPVDRILLSNGVYLAWLIALVATLGSLYFSEIRGFVPCELCWYQRILMYPLAIILAVASFRNDEKVTAYTLPLTVLGMAVASFHYAMQWLPDLAGGGLCTGGVPCSGRYINWLGFITIPFLSLIAFTLITTILTRTAGLRRRLNGISSEQFE